MDYVDLFAGIGGFALGAEWAGLKWGRHYYSEIDHYAIKVYEKHFPNSLPLGNIVTTQASNLSAGRYVVSGGFPCQAFSSAARGRNVASDLWPCMLNFIRDLMPAYVIAENVGKSPIMRAAREVKDCGYGTSVLRVGAHEIGGDHKRDRWWLVAHADNKSEFSVRLHARHYRVA